MKHVIFQFMSTVLVFAGLNFVTFIVLHQRVVLTLYIFKSSRARGQPAECLTLTLTSWTELNLFNENTSYSQGYIPIFRHTEEKKYKHIQNYFS